MQTIENLATATRKARVLIVDDHPVLREAVAQLINRQPDLLACAEAEDIAAALHALEHAQPDLMLLDLRLRHGDTIDFIRTSRALFPQVPIVVLTQHDEVLYADRVLRAGATGYVSKQEATEDVLQAIRTALHGEIFVSRQMAPQILRKLLNTGTAETSPMDTLSERELQVFQLLGQGRGSRQVAEELGLSIKTIETYRENIKHKLGLKSAPELIRQATAWVQRPPAAHAPELTHLFLHHKPGTKPLDVPS